MAPHSSTLAWNIPWTEEPDRLQSMGSRRVGHDWATSLSLFTFMHWRRKWQPTPVFLPGESHRQGSLVATVYGVAQSQTRLKRLSSSSSSSRNWKFPEFGTFLWVGRCQSGLSEIIPLICMSVIWGWYPVFSLWGVAAVWCLLNGRYSSLPSGLTSSPLAVAVVCDILCLLIGQTTEKRRNIALSGPVRACVF